jgi:hypothetical protein
MLALTDGNGGTDAESGEQPGIDHVTHLLAGDAKGFGDFAD